MLCSGLDIEPFVPLLQADNPAVKETFSSIFSEFPEFYNLIHFLHSRLHVGAAGPDTNRGHNPESQRPGHTQQQHPRIHGESPSVL